MSGRVGSEKGVFVNLGGASETESEGVEVGREKRRVFSERTVNLMSSSSSSIERREDGNGLDRNMIKETLNLRLDISKEDREVCYYEDQYRQSLKGPISNWVHGNDHDMNKRRPGFVNSSVDNGLEEIRHPVGDLVGSSRSRPIMGEPSVGRNGSVPFHRSARADAEQGRFLTSPYPEEGPSNYPPSYFHGYGKQNRLHNEFEGASRVENLENDRAELLRKLDKLKDQLNRSCDVAEKPRERVLVDRRMAPPPLPLDRYGRHDAYMPEGPSSLYSANMQPFAHDKHVPKHPYFNHGHGPIPHPNTLGLDKQDFYPPPRNVQNEFLGYEDPYLPPVLKRPPHQPYQDHFPGQYMDLDQGTHPSHQYETFFHQPACFCSHCYNQNWQHPQKVPPPNFGIRWSLNGPTNPIFNHRFSTPTYDSEGHNSRGPSHPQLHSRDHQPKARNPIDLDSDVDGYGYRHPRRVVVANGNGRVCHPIAGGAPFITCYNCFELLKLPKRLMAMGKNQQMVRCGACSTRISFELEKRGLVVLIPSQIKQVSTEVDDGSGEKLNENLRCSHGCSNTGASDSCSDDYDSSNSILLTDTEVMEPNLLSRDQRSNFSGSDKRQDPLSSSSSFLKDEQNPDNVIVQQEVSNPAESLSKDDASLPLPDSPLHEHPDYSSSNNVISSNGNGNKSKRNDQEKVILDRITSESSLHEHPYYPSSKNVIGSNGKGNKSKRYDQEKVILDRSTSQDNSVKDVSMATVMDVSIEYLHSSVSQDSVESRKDRPGINKGSESRSSRTAEDGRSDVFVNGQPIPDCVVRKAEKLAGDILPGAYWYVHPFIEEFNYPMKENCAAGNTNIFVNGRELNQKDLDLLAGRGLPTTRDKSYIIEITGKVLDEDTNEELKGLGKLAPTVEKAKHGFGMRVPRSLAQAQ
ncbi:uncharacterized protein LOC132287086 isoform X2 [Cornus florida]|uniref:uncharacterized protein LOC132287086 isoform X2 n=1 Tax=Cornus florida TaxID=4283 RepID=UPI0028A1BEDB|nr:uncharacterized protein LOC132287086 isoform X2 [Cornus florida]